MNLLKICHTMFQSVIRIPQNTYLPIGKVKSEIHQPDCHIRQPQAIRHDILCMLMTAYPGSCTRLGLLISVYNEIIITWPFIHQFNVFSTGISRFHHHLGHYEDWTHVMEHRSVKHAQLGVCLNVAGRDSWVEVAGAGAGKRRGCG